ncbi:LONGIFOLIA 2-like protein [Drosera capensis]
MSARLLYSLSEETPNSQKQRGCINGFVQVILDGRRSIDGRNHKRIHAGQSNKDGAKLKQAIHKDKELTNQKMELGKERNSLELSGALATLSGSSSSERSQKAEREPFFVSGNAARTYCQTKVQDAPKESIRGHSSSSKAATKEQEEKTIKHIDSPRPRYPSMLDKQKNSALHEPPRSINSGRNAGPTSSVKRTGATKDSPRLSFDEREMRSRSKSNTKLELPRLSLDSRRQAITRANSDLVPTELQTERGNNRRDMNMQQVPGTHRPISNVVAKLMGLDSLPDYSAVHGAQVFPEKYNVDKSFNMSSRSSRSMNGRELDQASYSPRNYLAHFLSPRLRRADSRASSESAPWNHWEEQAGSEKSVHKHDPQSLSVSIYGEIEKRLSELDFQNSGTDLRALKRIVEAMQRTRSKLHVNQETQAHDKATLANSSDLLHVGSDQGPRRANFQELNDDCKNPNTSRRSCSTEDILHPSIAPKEDKLPNSAKQMISMEGEALEPLPNLRRLRTRQLDKVPDPGKKQTTKVLASNPHLQDPSPQSLDVAGTHSRVPKVAPSKTSRLPKHIAEDEATGLNNSKVAIRNLKLDRLQHQAPTSPSNPIRIKQQIVQTIESGTFPLRVKQEVRNGGNTNISDKTSKGPAWHSQAGKSAYQRKITTTKTIKPAKKCEAGMQNLTTHHVDKKEDSFDGPTLKIATTVQEQPSPVSILDAAFYGDESPSPVKRKTISFGDDETPTTMEVELHAENMHHSSVDTRTSFRFERDELESETIKHIEQKPQQHKSVHNESQDSFISLPQNLNAKERYLCEILLASGFIAQFGFNFPSKLVTTKAQAINPKLFHILEQTASIFLTSFESISNKENAALRPEDKLERRLIFDVANEILAEKFSSTDASLRLRLSYNKTSGDSFTSGSQLLRELSEEIESLQANSFNNRFEDDNEGFITNMTEKDLVNESAEWTLFGSEISGLVLDIERLIFKDLVVELLDY